MSWQGRTLTQFADKKYTYDVNGIRTSKTVDGITCNYFYDGNNLVAEQRVGTATKWIYYIYGVDGVAGFKYDKTEYLYRKNIQGDITHIYTVKGELVAQYVYDAWGNCKVLTPAGKIDDNSDSIGNKNPFRYRSYYFDVDTKLYYLQTRYYDPATCRFISADSIEYLDPETLGGLNLYAYCNNNSVMYCDALGHMPQWLCGLLIGIVLAVSVAVSVATFGVGATIGLAVAGLLVGGIYGYTSAATQTNDEGKRWEAALNGAFTGMISVICSALGPVAGAVGGYIAGYLGEINNQYIMYGEVISEEDAVKTGFIYGISGGISGGLPVVKGFNAGEVFILNSILNLFLGLIPFTIDQFKKTYKKR